MLRQRSHVSFTTSAADARAQVAERDMHSRPNPRENSMKKIFAARRRPRHRAWNHNPDHASQRRLLQLREPEPGRQPGQRQLTSHRTDRLRALLSGEVVLVTEAGEEILRAGDCVSFRCATYPEITVSVDAG